MPERIQLHESTWQAERLRARAGVGEATRRKRDNETMIDNAFHGTRTSAPVGEERLLIANRIRALVAQRMSDARIAKRLGLAPRTVTRIRQENGIASLLAHCDSPADDPAVIERVRALAEKRVVDRQIAVAVGITLQQVKHLRKKHGIRSAWRVRDQDYPNPLPAAELAQLQQQAAETFARKGRYGFCPRGCPRPLRLDDEGHIPVHVNPRSRRYCPGSTALPEDIDE